VTRSALVVTADLAELDRLAQWLEAAGFLTVACAGPRLRTNCPRLDGERCVLRDAVDVAVVAMPSASGSGPMDETPEASCTTAPDNGTTIFVDGSGVVVTRNGAHERLRPLTKRSLVEAVEYALSRVNHPSRPDDRVGSSRTQSHRRVPE
jgi:hypothetical protein